ncbi:hypothetical protein GJ744_005253 [Endocarpon pusillum]|uniref:Uncharacterized protein n=1 Tax=Endocarpon pusillum TaxID=364733 RepID=A0A8H7DX74_9EURO|nr:hypothetical protein GJ744_005253 [Endocarpon pusillum]
MGCGDSRLVGSSDTSSEPSGASSSAQAQYLVSASARQNISQTRPRPSSQVMASPPSERRSRTPGSRRRRLSIQESDVPVSAAAMQQLQGAACTPYVPLYSSEHPGQDRPLASRLLTSCRPEGHRSPSRTGRSRTPEPPLRRRSSGSGSSQEHQDDGRPFSRTLDNLGAKNLRTPSTSQRRLDTSAPVSDPMPSSAKEHEEMARESPPPTPPKPTRPPPAPSAGARFRKSFEIEQLGSPAAKLQQQAQASPFSTSSASDSTASGSSSQRRDPPVPRLAPDGSSNGCSSRGHRLGPRYQCQVRGCACKVGCQDPDCEVCEIVKSLTKAAPKRSK